MPLARMILFLTLLISISAGLHFYIGWRLIPSPRTSTRIKRVFWGILAFSFLSIQAAFLGGRLLPFGPFSQGLAVFGFMALGVVGILFGLVIVRDLLLLGARVAPGGTDPARREFLRRASSLGVLGAGGVVIGHGLAGAARPPALENVRVPIDGLPEALRGFRIAQISDTHLGPTLGADFAAHVVARVNELEPDLIAFTGDIVDGYVDSLRGDVAPFADLRARHGVYFATGNHEYYWETEKWLALLRELGMDVLVNEHRMLDVGGARLAVAGVPDIREGKRVEGHAFDLDAAFAGSDDADFRLLLAHQPKNIEGAQRAGVDLQLSGHTHGGQIFPVNLLVHLMYPIVTGLGRFDDTWVYVNRGTAYWGPPMRNNGAGEITLLELASA